MALTVNSKPAGFQPIGGGELIYQFTEASISGKTNYRVEIELNGLSTIPVFQYRPDASLVVRADISAMLRAAVDLSFTPADRLVSTYVKYQAVWDEGSDSQVSLSGDVIYAYCGVNHWFNHRTKYWVDTTSGVFLIPTTKLYAWANRDVWVEFLNMGLPSDCKITYTPTGGSPVILGTFDGSVQGIQSVSYDQFYFDGDVKVQRVSDNTTYATIQVVVLRECSNPVYLKWINDLGGISTWLFSYNQISGFNPQELYREKTYTVSADGLTEDQWLMLQELNKGGVEYGDNLKSGVLCVDITDESYPVNVFPLEEQADTLTKRARHNFTLTFRYEDIPNILI